MPTKELPLEDKLTLVLTAIHKTLAYDKERASSPTERYICDTHLIVLREAVRGAGVSADVFSSVIERAEEDHALNDAYEGIKERICAALAEKDKTTYIAMLKLVPDVETQA